MAEEKTRKKTKVRTDADLAKGGLKSKMYLILRKAYNSENETFKKNDKKVGSAFKGVERLTTSKLPSAVFARAGKEGSEYWNLADTDAKIVSLKAAVKSAQSDIVAKNWTPAVQKAMNEFLDIRGVRAAGGTNTAILKGIQL